VADTESAAVVSRYKNHPVRTERDRCASTIACRNHRRSWPCEDPRPKSTPPCRARPVLSATRPSPRALRVPLGAQVWERWPAGHESGLLHGDVKPASILLSNSDPATTSRRRILLTDFGIARRMHDNLGAVVLDRSCDPGSAAHRKGVRCSRRIRPTTLRTGSGIDHGRAALGCRPGPRHRRSRPSWPTPIIGERADSRSGIRLRRMAVELSGARSGNRAFASSTVRQGIQQLESVRRTPTSHCFANTGAKSSTPCLV
jgi:serine/threonine protein kinase